MPRKRNNSLIPIRIPNPASPLRSGTIYQSLPILPIPIVIPHNMDHDWDEEDPAVEAGAVGSNGQTQADANQQAQGEPQANANRFFSPNTSPFRTLHFPRVILSESALSRAQRVALAPGSQSHMTLSPCTPL
jgi:hypothetical protein